ncbi:sugar phosphate isomerase/epimerase [Nonomuraea glycinis]|uniref:Xylose isomerase n=1 Tax=Nonomuraea glycinis TaxID=2047744 RepID=A0A918ABP5_9ACTN|nr:sugar phosphate isomerase/epimerase family protein [Nonomuraea glycinis]MCA2181222.1 sugar phosphate isomerase/epimerase [Nonomuraea glycinis]GGP13413.1 xylose isomerase [Nonomuraea glycinis]
MNARPDRHAPTPDAEAVNWAYCTNGFSGHRLPEALGVLAELGYTGAAITLDHGHLDPYAPGLAGEVAAIGKLLGELGMNAVVETGGRYTLDPRRKHYPTLLDDAADRRIDYLTRAIRVAAELGAPVVHLWSGAIPAGLHPDEAWARLARGCEHLLRAAERGGVVLGFEPEPGMLVADLAGYERLRELLGGPEQLGLTLDIGHCRCVEPYDVPECVRRALPYLVHVQIDDMRRGVHEHLEFGAGEIDFPPALAALDGYRGQVAVELGRHGHAAPEVARRSIDFLRRARERMDHPGRAADAGRP